MVTPRSIRRLRARRGQAGVMIALSIFAMLLLLAMATNTGIVVNDKIRMQTTVDAATYAAAYSEAASLNELTEINQDIADAVKQCRQVLQAGPLMGAWPETTVCGCVPDSRIAEAAVTMCKTNIDIQIGRFVARAPYTRTVRPALQAGEATADANFSGVNIDFFQGFPGSPTFPGSRNLRAAFNMGGSVMMPSVADIQQVTDTAVNYLVFVTCPTPSGACVPVPPMLGRTTYLKTWFYKEDRDPDVWVAGRASGTPAKQFLDTAYGSGGSDGGYFGASSTGGDDEIYAYSVAKPYDGSIGPSELNGIQQNGNMLGPTGVYISRGTTYPKLSMYDEYRARLAGINENLEGDMNPQDLVQYDGWMNGKNWDMDKFKH